MNVIYHDTIKSNPELFPLARQATAILEENVSPSGSSADVEWDAEGQPPHWKVSLKIRYGGAEVAALFQPTAMKDADRMGLRLTRLWGDVLEKQSHKMLQELLEGGREGG